MKKKAARFEAAIQPNNQSKSTSLPQTGASVVRRDLTWSTYTFQ